MKLCFGYMAYASLVATIDGFAELTWGSCRGNVMFRRIELINGMSADNYDNMIQALQRNGETIDKDLTRYWKTGLMGFGNEAVTEAWVQMPSPKPSIYRNCRFYFTEEGWRRYGRSTITACQQTNQAYRVLCIKEKSVDVVYRDAYQVAVRPKKKAEYDKGAWKK